jgi:hypothetical protein
MRNNRLLRYSLASLTLAGAALGGVLIACGDDSSGNSPDGSTGQDGASNEAGGGPDGGGGTDSGDAGTVTAAKLILVHAGTDLGPNDPSGAVRVCFATKSATDTDFIPTPFPALPHSDDGGVNPFPGIFIGTGGPFPSSGADYTTISLRPYMMNAETLAKRGIVGEDPATPRCGKLLADGGLPGGGTLQQNVDFWQLADIPPQTLKAGHTYMIAVVGCTADVSSTFNGKCGNGPDGMPYNPPGTPGPGNLKIVIMELDTSAVAANQFGVQVAHLSPQYQMARTHNPPLILPFTPVVGNMDASVDGGIFPATASGAEITYPQTPSPTALVNIVGVSTADGYFAAGADPSVYVRMALNNAGIAANAPFNGGVPASIQLFSTGKADTTPAYANGAAYTFVLIGDPLPSGEPDAAGASQRKLHYLAFPNVFTPPLLQ